MLLKRNFKNYLGGRVYLKTFLSLAMPNQYCLHTGFFYKVHSFAKFVNLGSPRKKIVLEERYSYISSE